MDFEFDQTELSFADTVRRYAMEQLAPDYQRWDAGERVPQEKVKQLAELGVNGLLVPEEYGGVGGSYVLAGIAAEEIARGDHNFTMFVQLCAIAADLIGAHASEELKALLLPQLASGDIVIALGLTEPGAGSDAAAIKTTARLDGDEWVISGEKASITFAGFAQHCIVFTRMGNGMGAVVVPLDAPGVTRRVYDSVGIKMSERGSLFFEDVRVPKSYQLGADSSGFAQAMEAFDYNRAIIALSGIGTAQQSLDETIEFAKQRKTFGKPLAAHAGFAFQIAEHSAMLTAARLLAYKVLWLRDKGLPHTKEAAMVKWMGPKAAVDAIHACITLNGWMGYDNELAHGQRLRDVLGLQIGDGTPEIMKGVIAREIFGREFTAYR